jgi:hypothetical protein
VASLNQHRRHLTNAQRAFAAARLADIAHGHNRHKTKVDSSKELSTSATPVSLAQAAKKTGTSKISAALPGAP